MLKSLKKSRIQKAHQKSDELIHKGITLLDGKLYKQAMIEFQNAFELSPNYASERLQKEFNEAFSVSDYESALSIGLILIKIQKTDHELANKLGNCARKQQNYKQANNLYRHALKIKKDYLTAFYNLAASMGKVDKYDEDVKESLKTFDKISDYIYPDYVGNSNIVEEIREEVAKVNKQERADLMAKMEQEIEEKQAKGEIHEADKLKHQFKQLSQKKDDPTHQQISKYFDTIIKGLEKDDSEESKEEYYDTIYNFGIYALKAKDADTALECFENLKAFKAKYKYLNMFIAIGKAYLGDIKAAIEIFVENLGTEQNNRFFNVNLGLMYRKAGNRLLSTKYLAVSATLLEKSDGLYHLSDLIRIADENLENGNLKKALKLYKIVVEENDDPNIWSSIGEIYMTYEKYSEALAAYREILRQDPKSSHAKLQIREIHDIYRIKGEAFYRDSKFKAAATFYEKALRVQRDAETIKETITVYKLLKNPKKVEALNAELEEIQKKKQERENEKRRLDYIKNGKISLKRKDYKQAIEFFELAFRMKLDKDVFVYLATIYKALKRNEEMQHLLERWNKMVEHDDKMKLFQKQEERKQVQE
ncbi:tetratricopeptide repeat protein [bacterium]|nr:tetratricopeptide repeat protein [bacterium]